MASLDLPPIGAYALVGDGRTAALASAEGSIDWLCLPRFDGDPVFGRLIDGGRGGRFSIGPRGGGSGRRRYLPGSAVLETTWTTGGSEVTLTDAMVMDVSDALLPATLLVRRVSVRGRPATLDVLFDPRFGLPGREPASQARRWGALVCTWGAVATALTTSERVDLEPGRPRTIEVAPERPVTFALSASHREPAVLVAPDQAAAAVGRTDDWWRSWSERIAFDGPLREPVVRSLITLRLLTYTPSGAPVAAPTTSLPEVVGGDRNWDYRLSWPRDASIGVEAFAGAEKPEEAHSFVHWLLHASRLTRPRLEVVYTLDGKSGDDEREVEGVHGYRGSLPVRVGNAAREQHQLDVYGWVADAVWRLDREDRVHAEIWRFVAGLADTVCERWRDADAGIWESRDDPRHFVHSKLMGWLAVDRALRMGERRRLPSRRRTRWVGARDAIAREIRARGLDDRGALVAALDHRHRDAAVLSALVEFEPPTSPVVTRTIEAVRSDLSAGGPLLYRYPPNPGKEAEGAFLACSFWLARALARTGRPDEAATLIEDVAGRANDVGLLAEEIDPSSGELLGNFPQALTHSALAQAALAVRDATEMRGDAAG